MGVRLNRRLREGVMLLLLAVSAYLLLSLLTFSPQDPGWSYTGEHKQVVNAGGPVGAWFADVFLNLFGFFAYVFPLMLAWSSWIVLYQGDPEEPLDYTIINLRALGFVLTLACGSTLSSLHVATFDIPFPTGTGGILGSFLMGQMVGVFSATGGTLLLLALFLGGVTLFTGVSWFTVMDRIGEATLQLFSTLQHIYRKMMEKRQANSVKRQRSDALKIDKKKQVKRKPPKIEPVIREVKTGTRIEKEKQVPLFLAESEEQLPPLALLDQVKKSKGGYTKEALEAISRLVEIKLRDFGIDVEVVAVYPGPVVTLFELQLAAGLKVSRITNLSKDLARALSTTSVRVVEVIPGKSVIGLEIPNEQREMVYLSEVLKSEVYDQAKSPLTMALGKNIAGHPEVADLGKMPHVLIAGTTGSGKSVAINAMVLSILYKAKPEDVRMIMVDPKMLELSVYEGIPHLLTPVVTDMKQAANALRWCVMEMEQRFRIMASLGVRNLAGYNKKIKEAEKNGEKLPNPLYRTDLPEGHEQTQEEYLQHMPYIVVIIDELADMMMVVGKKVEELIARLAQKARAAGVHLLLATQRPSVDVITGLIKANIPSRIAFQVSSRIDSRTILDQMGAETLLGHGDMLYLPPGTSIPQRIHGAFVDDNEVHRVVKHLKKMGRPDYIENILQASDDAAPGMAPDGSVEDADPLYDEAVRLVTETRRASISGVQRRLKIGYNRAARMIEEMERVGIVGSAESNGSRQVLAPPPPEV
ncbi:MAG: cell division protein FtsK [Gammaproteobacteria bacterium]|nr:cell division protein FtsK [Gammaproteobacteria bacterium]